MGLRFKKTVRRLVCKPLGRPPKQQLGAYQKQKEVIHHKSWIACIFFIMNLVKLEKIAEHYVVFLLLLKKISKPYCRPPKYYNLRLLVAA